MHEVTKEVDQMADIDRVMLKYPIGCTVMLLEDGHAEKHTVRRYIVEDKDIYIDLDPGGRYNLKRLEEMEIREKNPETVVSILRGTARELCDHYCRYPVSCTTDEELRDRCAECPVVKRLGI